MTLISGRSLCLTLVALTVATPQLLAVDTALVSSPRRLPDATICDVNGTDVEHQYAVSGRVKLLLVWTGRREVGEARFARNETEGARRLSLLVGTDPDRAPMRLNRWGYIAETTCNAQTLVTGVMTESKEQSVEQAKARGDDHARRLPLRAIRSRVSATDATTETTTIIPTRTVTYRDRDDVLMMSPSTKTGSHIAVPPNAESGFLRAVTSLMQESAMTYRGSSKPPAGLHRLYVYGGTLYDMTLRRSRKADDADELESDFQVRNRTTGATNQFQIFYTTSGNRPGVARRIVYRPRWWLELELLRKERS